MFNLEKSTLAVVTGASQGIGRTIALSIAEKVKNLTIILIARNEEALKQTKRLIEKANGGAEVKIYARDLSSIEIDDCTSIMKENVKEFENGVIFHNAGSLGCLDRTINLTDTKVWKQFFHLNVISASLLNSSFIHEMRYNAKNLFVVNISSLCGIQAFKNMAMYGAGKAARNLFFKVLAEEETDVKVLNYCPGPVDTNMVTQVIGDVKDSEVRSMFKGMRDNKTILSTEVTVDKLLGILQAGDYKSGDVIDFYDRI